MLIKARAIVEIIKWSLSTNHNNSWTERFLGIVNTLNPLFSPTIIILLSHKRTASTLFCSLAGQYKDVFGAYEILNPKAYPGIPLNNSTDAVNFIHMMSKRKPYFIFKVFPEQLERLNIDCHELPKLFDNQKTIWLHLIRENSLKQFASLKRAEITDIWLLNTNEKNDLSQTINLDLNEYRIFREKIVNYDKNIATIFSNSNYYRLTYEQLTKRPQYWFDRYFSELICTTTTTELTIPYTKQGTNLNQSIENWAELQTEIPDNFKRHELC